MRNHHKLNMRHRRRIRTKQIKHQMLLNNRGRVEFKERSIKSNDKHNNNNGNNNNQKSKRIQKLTPILK